MIEVTHVKYLGGFLLHLTFNDGTGGDVDLESELEGEVFAPLKDRKLFSTVRIDKELGTIIWPNGADLAPEYLHDRIASFAKT